jgi:hypothetical protein
VTAGRRLLAVLTLVGFATPAVRASGSGCSAQDRDALLVGGIARGVARRTDSKPSPVRCFATSRVWTSAGEEPLEPSDRVLARVRRIVRPHHVATRTDSKGKDAGKCATWESLTVGEPRCAGDTAVIPVEGEHCAPSFHRVGRHWEGNAEPCE